MVERARAKADRDAGAEDDRGYARTSIVGRQDEHETDAERGIEAELVKDPAQSRLHRGRSGGGEHERSLRSRHTDSSRLSHSFIGAIPTCFSASQAGTQAAATNRD